MLLRTAFRFSRGFACCGGSKKKPDLKASYFDLFGMPDDYDMDLGRLESKFKSLQFRYHPDKNTDPDAHEVSTHLNLAYATLRDPLKRAHYLLSGLETQTSQVDPAFLEVIANISDAVEQGDKEAVLAVQTLYEALVKDISTHIGNHEFDKALQCTKQLTFVDKLLKRE